MSSVVFRMLIVALVSFVVLGTDEAFSQEEPVVKIETVLVTIPVFVKDSSGNPVRGLSKGDFELLVDGKRQEIDFLSDTGPLNIAIVIDSNSNTSEVLDRIKRDAMRLIECLGPQERAMIIKFDKGYTVLSKLTSDQKTLRRAVGGIESSPDRIRVMLGVIHQVVFRELVEVNGRKALILFADPDSNLPPFGQKDSAWTVSGSIKADYDNLRQSDAAVYPIFYQTTSFPQEYIGKRMTFQELTSIPGMDYFSSLATLTGGKFYAAGVPDFSERLQHIVNEIRTQYVLAFHIDDSVERNRSIQIGTKGRDLVIRLRSSVRTGSSENLKKRVERLSGFRMN